MFVSCFSSVFHHEDEMRFSLDHRLTAGHPPPAPPNHPPESPLSISGHQIGLMGGEGVGGEQAHIRRNVSAVVSLKRDISVDLQAEPPLKAAFLMISLGLKDLIKVGR